MIEADACVVERIEKQTLSPWSQSSLLSELQQDRGVVLVAEAAVGTCIVKPSQILGWCACRFFAPEAELLKISVNQTSRREGIASQILNHLERFLVSRDVRTLFLEVRSQNQIALNFYTKSAFLQVGKRSGYYKNPEDSALIFQKML